MSFWDWSLAAYARAGAAEALLHLQDSHRQSVPYLLWALWAASGGRALAPDRLAQGAALAGRWEGAAVAPLRTARRALKGGMQGMAPGVGEALRERIKALELDAERALIDALEPLAPPPGPAGLDPEAALSAAAALWPYPAPPSALRPLLHALA
jgi:uncharacterized protein (TIGR02444 family)